jgi:hypothetical protein
MAHAGGGSVGIDEISGRFGVTPRTAWRWFRLADDAGGIVAEDRRARIV